VHDDGAFDFGVVAGVGKGCGEVGSSSTVTIRA